MTKSRDLGDLAQTVATSLPTALGTAGQTLVVNSGGTALEFADAATGGGGGSLEATASGALADGDKVVINTDGTVSVVSSSQAQEGLGSATSFTSNYTYYIDGVYDANAQKVVIVYRNGSVSNKGYAVVGTVSGTSISFGTPVAFEAGNTQAISAAYDAASQKIVIAYRDAGNSSYGTAIVGTVSGTSISFGTAVVFESYTIDHCSVVYDENAQKVVIVYQSDTNNFQTAAIVGTVSGTSISFGTAVVVHSGAPQSVATAYDANAQKIVFAIKDASNSNYGYGNVLTVSGTSVSAGTGAVFNSAATDQVSATYDSNAQKVVIAYKNQSNYGAAVVASISGTTLSFGTPVVFESATINWPEIVYDVAAQKVTIAYTDNGNSAYGTYISGTVSGTSISFGTAGVFENGGGSWLTYLVGITYPIYDANAGKIVIAHTDSDGTGSAERAGLGIVLQNAGVITTNLTAENYIGISDAAYSDTATATIQIAGSVDDAQSGLTAGQAYYVQIDGTLSTTPDSPSVFAGTAVSSTKLIVKG